MVSSMNFQSFSGEGLTEPHPQTRVVHGSDGPTGRVGSGHDFVGFLRVGSALRIY